jgi:hypothetical protein
MTLKALAKACHLRVDDTVLIFKELGFLQCRRKTETSTASTRRRTIEATTDAEEDEVPEEPTEWTDVEIVITRDAVDEQWTKWRVRNAPMLSEEYVLL